MLGWDGEGVSLAVRSLPRPMGMAVHDGRVAVALRRQILFLAESPGPPHDGGETGQHHTLSQPGNAFFTGDLNLHDMAFGSGRLWAINTRFSCLSVVCPHGGLDVCWRPWFISNLSPDDRCHLNGLALVDGQPKYVTALGRTDEGGAWRVNRGAGGVLIDVPSNEILTDHLCMPHSPRWHDGRLWLLDSGLGQLCTVDLRSGRRTVVCALPGYSRGLCFVGPYAVIGLSLIRKKHVFAGLPVQQHHPRLCCGVAVVDTRSGREHALFEFTAGVEELYDVHFLPGIAGTTMSAGRSAMATSSPHAGQ